MIDLLPSLTLTTWIWIAFAPPAFIVLMVGWDPVGRVGGGGFGVGVESRLAWILMELPALATFPLIYLSSGNLHVVGNVAVVLWLAHYGHRTFVWPWFVPKKGSTVPITMIAMAVFFNGITGGLIGWFMGYHADYGVDWLADPRFLAGLALMFAGAALNVWADYRLLDLRKASGGQRVMPQGGAFEYLACPNLAGEILEWIGFALLTWSFPALAFAIWTVANLAPRAFWRRNQYRESFADYPKGRAALIPKLL